MALFNDVFATGKLNADLADVEVEKPCRRVGFLIAEPFVDASELDSAADGSKRSWTLVLTDRLAYKDFPKKFFTVTPSKTRNKSFFWMHAFDSDDAAEANFLAIQSIAFLKISYEKSHRKQSVSVFRSLDDAFSVSHVNPYVFDYLFTRYPEILEKAFTPSGLDTFLAKASLADAGNVMTLVARTPYVSGITFEYTMNLLAGNPQSKKRRKLRNLRNAVEFFDALRDKNALQFPRITLAKDEQGHFVVDDWFVRVFGSPLEYLHLSRKNLVENKDDGFLYFAPRAIPFRHNIRVDRKRDPIAAYVIDMYRDKDFEGVTFV